MMESIMQKLSNVAMALFTWISSFLYPPQKLPYQNGITPG